MPGSTPATPQLRALSHRHHAADPNRRLLADRTALCAARRRRHSSNNRPRPQDHRRTLPVPKDPRARRRTTDTARTDRRNKESELFPVSRTDLDQFRGYVSEELGCLAWMWFRTLTGCASPKRSGVGGGYGSLQCIQRWRSPARRGCSSVSCSAARFASVPRMIR